MGRWSAVLPAAALALAGCGGDAEVAVGVQIAPGSRQPIRAEPGARAVVLMAVEVEGIAPVAEVVALRVGIVFDAGTPAPLATLELVLDADRDGRFDPDADAILASLATELGGRSARAVLSRSIRAAAREQWLLIGNVRPVATGTSFALTVHPTDLAARDGQGRQLAAAAAGLVNGPPVSIEPRRFATSAFLTGGGARAALTLPADAQPVRILMAGSPATDLRQERPGLWSFLLPPAPAGKADIQVLDAAGTIVERIADAAICSGGRGPARFVDRSLDLLPPDHAFSQDAEVADLNGDGAPDLLVPCYSRQRDRLYLNDGHGRFADVSDTHLPAVLADTVHMEPVDVDGDGDVDVALAVEAGQNRLYLNDGHGRLRDVTDEPGRMPRDADYSEDIQAADLDGDGDFDLVVANLVDPGDQRQGGQIRVYVNDGAGHFRDETAARIAVAPSRAYDVELGDLDGDGDPDLFAACYGEPNRLYRNDAGRFADVSAALPVSRSFHTSAALGDLDGDGDLDILVGSFVGQSRCYRNAGSMQFLDATAGLLQGEMSTYDVALGDLDGDGDLDLLYANTANPSVLALNDGSGRFTAAAKGEFFTPDDNAYDVQVLDADGDGALDVFISAWGDRQDTLYLARTTLPPDGEPRLTRVEPSYGPPAGGTWVTLRGSGFSAATLATIGGLPLSELSVQDERTVLARVPPGTPGPAALTLKSGDQERRYANVYTYEPLPPGAFEDVTATTLGAEPRASTAVAAGDLDLDGLPDLVFADQGAGARLRINSPSGRFQAAPFPPIAASANDVALADLDADGKLDLVLVDAGSAPWLFPGTGDGGFAVPLRLPEPSTGAEEVAVGDLDGDGDLDLVFAVTGPEVVLRNEGQRRFVPVAQPGIAADPSKGLALGDADGDGDRDLLVANFLQRTRLYLNDGAGRFVESPGALPDNGGDQSYGIALADVDGDRDLDVAIANGGAQVNRLLLNGGRGAFTEAPAGVFRAALGGGAHVVFADVDRDGDPDLFSSHFWGNNHLYFSEAGRLVERAGMLPNSPGGFAGATFADLDRDGDLDLVLAAFWGGSRVLRNPGHRQ